MEGDAARRERILNWQKMVVVIFLRNLLRDAELVRATKALPEHLKDFARFIESEMRMGFWRRNDKNRWQWVSHPERYAQQLLRTFLNGRLENHIYVFEEVRSGAGFIDILIVSPSEESVIVELKMCGNGYSQSYAQDGMKQIIHYMENKNVENGCLMVFDSRPRNFTQGFQQVPEAYDRNLITTIITDVRPYVKPEDVVADVFDNSSNNDTNPQPQSNAD
jgi:hypothetical protein